MAIQTFTSGQVLTAAQVNALQANDYNQTVSTKTVSYVLVAADKGTRVVMNSASATTITVNTSLFSAGDTLFIQNIGAGICTITAGTATVSTAGSLVLAANAGGTLYFTSAGVSIFFPNFGASSGLTLVKAQTIGSAVSSVAVTDAYSTTYDAYKIIVAGGVSSVGTDLNLINTGSTASYKHALIYIVYGGTTVVGESTTTGTSFQRGGVGSTSELHMNVDVLSPFLAKPTIFSSFHTDPAANGVSSCYHNVSTSFTGFTITPASGTLTGGTIYVYGYAKA